MKRLVAALARRGSRSPRPRHAGAQPAAEGVAVRFELNDALVKGRALAGVSVSLTRTGGGGAGASGQTGPDGRWATRLAPGLYAVSYRLNGYVPYTSEATEIREEGQLVTVSLSRSSKRPKPRRATCASSSTGARGATR